MSKDTILKISALLAFIFSATGAILLLVTPWAYWWYSYQDYFGRSIWNSGEVRSGSGIDGYWINAFRPVIVCIDLAALLLIVCTIISLLTLISGKIKNRKPIVISLILAFVVVLIIIIGALLTGDIMASEGLAWSFGTGFYGGLIGSLLTILCILIMLYTKEK